MPRLSFLWNLPKASAALAAKVHAAVVEILPQQLTIIRDAWVAAVSGKQLPGMKQPVNSPPYAEALQKQDVIDYPYSGDPLWGRVVVQDKAVTKIEHGTLAWDMKPFLLGGKKARRGKKGQRYNVIPLGMKTPKPGAFRPGYTSGMFVATSPFRTVSDFSPANSWIYPARPGVEVAAAVKEHVKPIIVQTLRERILRAWR